MLRRADDHVWVQRVLYNRAVLYGYRQQFAAAEADLQEAAQLCAQLELDLSLGFVHENLSWINAQRGDVPAALHYLDLAERSLRAQGAPVGELLTDRSQLLLSVRLISEAMQAAEEAVREFEQQGRKIGLPEARLLLAQAAILDGQANRGLAEARNAAREFGRQRRPRWATLARFTVLRARLAGDGRPGAGVRLRQLERAADDLAAAGWRLSAREARLLADQLGLTGLDQPSPHTASAAGPAAARGQPCSAPRPGMPRGCGGGPVATATARRPRRDRAARHRRAGPAWAPRICAPTPPGTGSTWPGSACGWRSTAAGPPG